MDIKITSLGEGDLQLPRQHRLEQTRRANAKVDQVCERLRLLASELGPGSRLPTIRELCSTLHTSSATLTTALNVLEHEQLFYRKERQGIFVSDTLLQRSIHVVFNISLIARNSASPFWSLLWGRLAQVAEQRAKSKNEHIAFHFPWRAMPQQLPDEYLALLNSPAVDGSLIIGFNAHSDEHEPLLTKPHVVYAGGGDWMVKDDARTSARMAAEVLLEKNCQRIGYWSSQEEHFDNPFFQAYYFYQALQQQGAHMDPSHFRYITEMSTPMRQPLTFQERGYLLVKEVFGSSQGEKPDGLYINDDLVTDGALVAFEELGLRIGKDVHLVSLANIGSPILFGRTQHMTLLEQSSEELVRSMFSLLESLLNGERPNTDSLYIQPRLREG